MLAAKALGFDASEAVVFEDAPAGLVSAQAAGAATVVVGGYEGAEAAGLPRVADLKSVHVSAKGSGFTVTLG
jgi:sugar-phosphatase